MAPVPNNILVKFPQELLDGFYLSVLQDVVASDGLIEVVEGDSLWNHGFYRYTNPADDGPIQRRCPSSPPASVNIALMMVHPRVRNAICKYAWKDARSRLVSSNTVVLTRLAPAFSRHLQEITILKRFQAGVYCDVGTPAVLGIRGHVLRDVERQIKNMTPTMMRCYGVRGRQALVAALQRQSKYDSGGADGPVITYADRARIFSQKS